MDQQDIGGEVASAAVAWPGYQVTRKPLKFHDFRDGNLHTELLTNGLRCPYLPWTLE